MRVTKEGGSRREQILDCALHLIAVNGVHALSTRDLAKSVGISQPSLYAHFKSRDEIVVEVGLRAFETLQSAMRRAAKRHSGIEALKAIAHEYIKFGLSHPDSYRVAFMLESRMQNESVEQAILNAGVNTFGIYRQALIDCFPAHSTERCTELAQSSWAALHGLVSLLIARPGFPWHAQRSLVSTHVDLIAAGLAAGEDTA